MDKSKEKVLQAAKKVFIEKGFEGARMQEIADTAGINKGLLHYYFKSKERLFFEVIKGVIGYVMPQLDVLIKSDESISIKIRQFVDIYIDMLIKNPFLPAFILSEINLRGDLFVKDIMDTYDINPTKLIFQIQMETQNEKIRPINPFSLMINMISMCVFPFIARPIFTEMTGLSDEEYFKLMESRKKEVADFILLAIEK